MDEKMEMQLPVPVENKKTPAVVFVSLWGLFNAAVLAITVALAHIFSAYINSSELLSVEMTDAELAKGNALVLGYVWCSVLQAAAGTLALLLADRRGGTRWALAYVVLAATVAGHCMYASVVGILPTPAGLGYFFTIATSAAILFFAMGDLLGFLALLVGSAE